MMNSSFQFCSVLFLLLFKFTLFYQTGYNAYKSGAEFFCTYGRPGIITLREDFSYSSFSRDWLHININSGEHVSTFKFDRLSNETFYVKSERKYYKFLNFKVDQSFNNDTYMKTFINSTDSHAALYYRLYLNFGELVAFDHQYPLIFEEEYRVEGKYFYTHFQFIEEDCSFPYEVSSGFFKLYLLLMITLTLCYLYSLIPTKFKRGKILYFSQVSMLTLIEALGLKVLKVQKYCYNKNYRSYHSVGHNFVIKFVKGGRVSEKIQSWGLQKKYIDHVLGVEYTIHGDYLIEKEISNGSVNISKLDLNKVSKTVLKRVFWANLNLGYPVVEGEHCLSVPQIIAGLRCGFGLSLCLTGEKYFGEEELEMSFYMEASRLPQKLKEKLILHNEMFFGSYKTKCLILAISSNLCPYNRPAECLNSQWKMYLSDCNYIMGDFGLKVKCFEKRKETACCRKVRAIDLRRESNNVDLLGLIYRCEELTLNSKKFEEVLKSSGQEETDKQLKQEVQNSINKAVIIPYNEVEELQEKIDDLFCNHGPLLEEFNQVVNRIESGSNKPIDEEPEFVEAMAGFSLSSEHSLITILNKMQNNVRKKKKYSSLHPDTLIGATDLHSDVTYKKLKCWLAGVKISEIYPALLRIKGFLRDKYQDESRREKAWNEIYHLIIQSKPNEKTIETIISRSAAIKRIVSFLSDVKSKSDGQQVVSSYTGNKIQETTVSDLQQMGLTVSIKGSDGVSTSNLGMAVNDCSWKFTVKFKELSDLFRENFKSGITIFIKRKEEETHCIEYEKYSNQASTSRESGSKQLIGKFQNESKNPKTGGKFRIKKYGLRRFKFMEELIKGGGYNRLLSAFIEGLIKKQAPNRKFYKKHMLEGFKINRLKRGVVNSFNTKILQLGQLELEMNTKNSKSQSTPVTNKISVISEKSESAEHTNEELENVTNKLKLCDSGQLRDVSEIILRRKLLSQKMKVDEKVMISLTEIIKIVNKLKMGF